MKKSKFLNLLLGLVLVLAMGILCAACTPADDSSGSDTGSTSDSSSPGGDTADIAAPANFKIESNAYSFDGVEGASYYVMYFYEDASAADEDYSYALPQIRATTANDKYSGEITTVPAGTYNVRLFAFDADDMPSEAAVISDCAIVSELSAPQIEYWYDATTNELDLQLTNFYDYSTQSTPVVEVTVTDNETQATFTDSFTVENIEGMYESWTTDQANYPYIEFAALTQGHSYSVTAQAVAQSSLAASSDTVTSFESITLGTVNAASAGFDKVWSSNVVGDIIASLDVTETDEILLSSENSTVSEIADGALMNFRYRQAAASGRKDGFKRDFGYGITAVKDAVPAENCAYSYTLSYAQGTNTGDGYMYLYEDGTAAFVLNAPATGVPVGANFTGGWLYLDGEETTVAVNISINYLVDLFAD